MIKPQISGRGPIVASQLIPGKDIREQNPKSIKIRSNSLLPVKKYAFAPRETAKQNCTYL